MRRVTIVLLFGAIFAAELGWAGISPLLPSFQDRGALSDVQTGLIVSLASVGILIVSLPASALTNRYAVRTLTLASLATLALGNIAVGVATSYGGLLAGRLIFGMGLGTMWVAGIAWLHDAAGEQAPRALALTTSVVGAASLIGPALTGFVADHTSLSTPFLVLGAIDALFLIALGTLPSPSGRSVDPGPPLRDMLRAARSDTLLRASLVLTLAVALMWLSTELLVPLRLDAYGFSASGIGLAFSAASITFVAASAITSARAERRANLRFAAVWTALFAGAVVIAAVGVSSGATMAFLVAMGITTGVLIALTFPLGVAGSASGGYTVAVVGALINLVWAVSGLVGPTVGGAAAQFTDDRLWFFALAVCGFAVAAWMWRQRTPITRSSRVPVRASSRSRRG